MEKAYWTFKSIERFAQNQIKGELKRKISLPTCKLNL